MGRALSREQPAESPSTLLTALGPTRLSEGRLSGQTSYAPYPTRVDGRRAWKLLRSFRAKETAIADRHSPDQLREQAFFRLIAGKLDLAIADLEIAVDKAPIRTDLLSDLSALYGERARTRDRPEDYVNALEMAERAASFAPGDLKITFNRALALEDLFFYGQARETWCHYLRLDGSSPWAHEARKHLQELAVALNHQQDQNYYADFFRAIDTGQGGEVIRLAKQDHQEARSFFELFLLKRWAEAMTYEERSFDQRRLMGARCIADTLAREGGDRIFQSIVAEMERAYKARPGHRKTAVLIQSLLHFGAGVDAPPHLVAEAKREFDAAAQGLRSIQSSALMTVLLYRVDLHHHAWRGSGQGYDDPWTLAEVRQLAQDPALAEYPSLEARIQQILGDTAHRKGRLTDAITAYRRALDLFERVGEKENLAAINWSIASVLESLGQPAEAWRYRYRSLAWSSKQPPPGQVFYSLGDAVNTALAQRKALTALRFQERLVALTAGQSLRYLHLPTLLERARINAALGRVGEAKRDFQMAIDELLTTPARFRGLYASEIDIARSEIDESDNRAAALKLNHSQRALFNELDARADLEFRRGDTAAGEGHLERALDELDRQRVRLESGSPRISFLDRAWPIYERMVALQLNLVQPEKALGYLERFRARALLDQIQEISTRNGEVNATGWSAAPLTSQELQRRLPANTIVVVYAVVDDRLVTWLVRRSGIALASDSPHWSSVAAQVERLHQARREGSVEMREVLEQLHHYLVAPWKTELHAGERIIFVPAHSLHGIPFAALLDPSSGRFLIQDHPTGVATSASEFIAAAERDRHVSASPPASILIVGDPIASGALRSLPGSVYEIEILSRTYAGLDTRVLRQEEATSARVRDSLDAFDLVHFAMHAEENLRDPSLSRLVLSPEGNQPGELLANDIVQHRMPRTRLVVLAACNTHAGPISPSEGIQSLTAAFLAAGVPAVVGTLWFVDDQNTARLSVRFHQELRRGADALSALRTAQLAEIAAHPDRRDWTWASFQVFGGVSERAARQTSPGSYPSPLGAAPY